MRNNEMKAYGTCPACGQCLRLSSRGRILGHSEQAVLGPKTCKGSGDAPVEAEEHTAPEVAESGRLRTIARDNLCWEQRLKLL